MSLSYLNSVEVFVLFDRSNWKTLSLQSNITYPQPPCAKLKTLNNNDFNIVIYFKLQQPTFALCVHVTDGMVKVYSKINEKGLDYFIIHVKIKRVFQ